MKDIKNVLEDVKQIDCPPDRLEEKIMDAYYGYEYKGNSHILIDRKQELDKIDLQAYSIHADDKRAPQIIAMVKEGMDHYVATVMDAYIKK